MTAPGLAELAAAVLADRVDPVAVVLSRQPAPPVARRIASRCPGARVATITDLDDTEELRLLIAAVGRPDLLVDIAGAPGARRRFEETFPHLRPGGVALVRSGADSPFRRYVDQLAVERREGLRPTPGQGRAARDHAVLVRSMTDLTQVGDLTRVTQGGSFLAKLRDEEHDRFLALRPAAGRRLATLEASSLASRAEVRVTSRPPRNPLPATLSSPPLSLREHLDVVTVGRSVAHGDGFVLPVSFRKTDNDRPKAPPLADLARGFLGQPAAPERRLDGTWFLLDSPVPQHFGHALTEQLGHLWGWAEARERHPDLRGLLHLPPGTTLAAWQRALFVAAGVEPDRIEVVHEPVAVERLVSTSPAYVIGGRLHPVVAETWARVGDVLEAAATTTASYPRLFHTRGPGKRDCRNQAEVEELARVAGFVVLRPEEHGLADQVRLVRRAEVVAGFAGSGLFHTALSVRPQRVVVIGSASYPSHNEYAFAAVHGHRLDLVVCEPDLAQGDSFTAEAFHSDYAVDWDREGRQLRAWLEE